MITKEGRERVDTLLGEITASDGSDADLDVFEARIKALPEPELDWLLERLRVIDRNKRWPLSSGAFPL